MTPDQLLANNDLLRALDLLGVVVMGITGGALAARLQFDAVGYAVIGIVSGLGGGILRDLILDVGVPAAFSGPWYLVCALSGAGFSYLIHAESRLWQRLMIVFDALALGLWAASGTAKSLNAGLEPLPAVLLGVVSAVGGGAIRDVIVGRVPAIFGGNPLYATNALVTAVTTWAVLVLGLPGWSILGPVLLGSGLAVLAAWKQWSLPQHREWQVTMSAAQMKSMVRRVRRAERQRVATETGAIPVLTDHELRDDFAADSHGEDDSLEDYLDGAEGSGEGLDRRSPSSADEMLEDYEALIADEPAADEPGIDEPGAEGEGEAAQRS